VPDLVLQPDKALATKDGDDAMPYTEASLPGHLRGEDEADAGENAGDVLPGDAPITAALLELKKPMAQAAPRVPKG
jgi:carboxyl-terminal processing protease